MTIDTSEYVSDISFTFNNVDRMTDEQFKTCIAKMFLAKYPDASSTIISCNKLINCSNGQEVGVRLTVKY